MCMQTCTHEHIEVPLACMRAGVIAHIRAFVYAYLRIILVKVRSPQQRLSHGDGVDNSDAIGTRYRSFVAACQAGHVTAPGGPEKAPINLPGASELDDNEIGDEGGVAIGKALETNSSLTNLK